MNPRCSGCYYPSTQTLPLEKVRSLIDVGVRMGLNSVALGGGEPTIYPEIQSVISHARRWGLYSAMTTNGLSELAGELPNRVSISFDSIHHGLSEEKLRDIIIYYKGRRSDTSINHIVTSLSELDRLITLSNKLAVEGLHTYLLLEKPIPRFTEWGKLKELINQGVTGDKIWLDPCLALKLGYIRRCDQGLHSLTVFPDGSISKCSNLQGTHYSSLKEAWLEARKDERCGSRDGFIGISK